MVGLVLACALASGCAELTHVPDNFSAPYDPEKSSDANVHQKLSFSSNICPPPGTSDFIQPGPSKTSSKPLPHDLVMRYSPGDRFNMSIYGAPEFSGDFAINADGVVILPQAGEIKAVGLTNTELQKKITDAFIRAQIFEGDSLRISVRPVLYAPVNITISGAVFLPGRYRINEPKDLAPERGLNKFGDSPVGRFMPSAFEAGYGVRPDADLTRVELVRNGVAHMLNWQGAITGAPVDDVPLIEGDHITVHESACFQSALVRPSQITPAGIRIFISNLTQPAQNNSNSAITKESFSVPYGTRFLAGLVSANCVGGSLASNAGRYAVLISRNPKTRQTEVVQRAIEELVLRANRDELNPYLMPDDAIACYDSRVTDFREIMTTLQAAALPAATYRSAVP